MGHDLDVERATARVIVSITSPRRAAGLVRALGSQGFEVTTSPSIDRIAEDVAAEKLFVPIVDDARPGWLRDVADLVLDRPSARPLALIDVESAGEMLAAVSAGVVGFVAPSAGLDALARTVRELLAGGAAIPRRHVGALVDEIRRGRGRTVETAVGAVEVTEREWEILQLLLQRRSTKEIAELLFVSVGTVRSHVSALGRKLGATDRKDTIRLLERGSR